MLLKGAVSYYTVAVGQDLSPPDPHLIWLTVPIVQAYQPLLRVMDISTMDITGTHYTIAERRKGTGKVSYRRRCRRSPNQVSVHLNLIPPAR